MGSVGASIGGQALAAGQFVNADLPFGGDDRQEAAVRTERGCRDTLHQGRREKDLLLLQVPDPAFARRRAVFPDVGRCQQPSAGTEADPFELAVAGAGQGEQPAAVWRGPHVDRAAGGVLGIAFQLGIEGDALALELPFPDGPGVEQGQAGDGLVAEFRGKANGRGGRQGLQTLEALARQPAAPGRPGVGQIRFPELVGGVAFRLFRPGVGGQGRVALGTQVPGGRDRAAGQEREGQHQARGQRGDRRVAPAPFAAAAKPSGRPGANGLAAQESAQVVRQRRRGGITCGGGLFQTLEADGLQVHGDLGVEQTRRCGLDVQHLEQRFGGAFRAERRPVRDHLVEDRPQRIDVAGRADLRQLSRRLFGRHVAGRAQDLPAAGQVGIGRTRLANPKSVIRGRPDSSIKMFEGFKSRCTVFRWCA